MKDFQYYPGLFGLISLLQSSYSPVSDFPLVLNALLLLKIGFYRGIGPDELKLNEAKPIHQPGPHQLLCRVEAVCLCFSDLKLLKQFDSHARKAEIVSGIDRKILDETVSR